MRKVNLDVMRPWIVEKVTELNGMEDDLVVDYAMSLLEDTAQPVRFHTLTVGLPSRTNSSNF